MNFKTILKSLCFLTMAILMAHCGSQSSVSPSSSTEGGTESSQSVTTFKNGKSVDSLKYFLGGWFGPQPNYTHDAVFTFAEGNNRVIFVKPGETCQSRINLKNSEVKKIFRLLNKMKLKEVGAPTRVDGGTEYVELNFKDNSRLQAYIDSTEAPQGSYEITNNGNKISEYLKSILTDDSRVEKNCDTNPSQFEVHSIKYFRGGWYGPAGQRNWAHDYTLQFKDYDMKSKTDDEHCFDQRVASHGELVHLLGLIRGLQVRKKQAGEPMAVDGGYDIVTLYNDKGDAMEVHLAPDFAPVGSQVATNGQALAQYLKHLDDRNQYQFQRLCSGGTFICTRDINQWGHPSQCTCETGKTYNQQTGRCENQSVQYCTADINQWGHPSVCSCSAQERYNPRTGQCEAHSYTRCTRDINPWGFPSYCECEHSEYYCPPTGQCEPY